jgi:DNA polymerase IV
MEGFPSSQTLAEENPNEEHAILDLSALPPIFVLTTHFQGEHLHNFEERLENYGALLTYDPTEARLFIGKVKGKRRAEIELRGLRVFTQDIILPSPQTKPPGIQEPASKKRRSELQSRPVTKAVDVHDSSTEEGETSEDDALEILATSGVVPDPLRHTAGSLSNPISIGDGESAAEEDEPAEDRYQSDNRKRKRDITTSAAPTVRSVSDSIKSVISVVQLEWVNDSVLAGRVLPLEEYLVYQGKLVDQKISSPIQYQSPSPYWKVAPRSQHNLAQRPHLTQGIIERAKADAAVAPARKPKKDPFKSRRERAAQQFRGATFVSQSQGAGLSASNMAHLLQQTTSEYEGESSDIPARPAWVKANLKYACQRQTPPNPPNDPFIDELKKIRKARLLTGDEIGVRAYSTSIAALAAYPYPLTSPKEILALPGCDVKIANLWIEYKNTSCVKAADDAENDETMQVLRLFYDIWGVGAPTAREFYFKNGWRDLDDVIEHGWSSLTRVQQIGVKYYDEFKDPIPRSEVESIAATIHAHAIRVRDSNITCTIVGGYRRGKDASGDVDVILSHPSLECTANLAADVVASLEDEGWVTHTLLLSLHGTNRGQATLPFRTSGQAGHGFDTLDKALVVWQYPVWPTQQEDVARDPKAKNPNVHRRVDIIVSPWRTVGCAIMGWSGGTTFQRDLRRYAKAVKGWKFDSSGVRDRRTGEVVQLEGVEGVEGTDAVEAERRVFKGLGLEWVEPAMRCTG